MTITPKAIIALTLALLVALLLWSKTNLHLAMKPCPAMPPPCAPELSVHPAEPLTQARSPPDTPPLTMLPSTPQTAAEAERLIFQARSIPLKPFLGSHRPDKNAIFAMATNYDARTFKIFLRSARAVFQGDIVLGTSHPASDGVEELLSKYAVVAYAADNCKKGEDCMLGDVKVGAALLRYELYKFWGSKYAASSLILVTDFRDAVLQSDPFVYHPREWQKFDLVVFQEFHPNKVINRCPFNSGWLESCYGKGVVDEIGDNIVLCSGVTLGTRNGIIVYSNLIVQEYHRTKCTIGGIDQGFHNFLYYTGVLSEHMKVKSYPQGEGPVNTIGAMHPTNRHNLKGSLRDYWKIVDDKGYILNWNGERSPVVHQYDRFGNEANSLQRLGESSS